MKYNEEKIFKELKDYIEGENLKRQQQEGAQKYG